MSTSSSTVSDCTLAERIGNGDKEAFHLLFSRYDANIFRFCVLLVGNYAVAQDIHQDTFFKFYVACRKGTDIRNVRGWLISKSRSLCLNFLRDSKRRTELLQRHQQEGHTHIDVNAIGIEEYLQKALFSIPDRYREALILYEIEGYSYKEIAEYLDVDFHTVKNRIYQAKRALQKILDPVLNDDNQSGTTQE